MGRTYFFCKITVLVSLALDFPKVSNNSSLLVSPLCRSPACLKIAIQQLYLAGFARGRWITEGAKIDLWKICISLQTPADIPFSVPNREVINFSLFPYLFVFIIAVLRTDLGTGDGNRCGDVLSRESFSLSNFFQLYKID